MEDPNGDGVYGADLGARLIRPGHPEKSYLFLRLTDPTAGPLMPRANCCFWTKAALRAFYCWVAGLTPNGANARDPIDYASCPAGPVEDVLYPEPGPMCASSGLCPVAPRIEVTSRPNWSNIYPNILKISCGGGDALPPRRGARWPRHAHRSLGVRGHPRARRARHDSKASLVYQRISPDLCLAPDCRTMPLDRDPLEPRLRDVVRQWIEGGALKKGRGRKGGEEGEGGERGGGGERGEGEGGRRRTERKTRAGGRPPSGSLVCSSFVPRRVSAASRR